MQGNRVVRTLLNLMALVLLGIFMSPLIVVVATSFTSGGLLQFPPPGFSLKWYQVLLTSPQYLQAIQTSFILAAATAVVSAVLGTVAALGMEYAEFRGKDLLTTFFLGPLVLPHVVIGAALLQYLGSMGLTRTPIALFIGHIIITIPYVIRMVLASLANTDPSLVEAARDLGASPMAAIMKVTLPVIKAGVIAGTLFAFVISWIDVEVSLFLVPGTLMPIPVQIYNYVQYSVDPTISVISSVSVYVAAIILLLVDLTVGMDRIAETA